MIKDGRIEIEPAPLEVRLVERKGLTVAVPSRPVRPLRTAEVAQTLAALRGDRASATR